MRNIGAIIAERRNELALSQDQLADLSGVSKTTIWKIENNQSLGSRLTIEKIASALQISISELYMSAGLAIAEGYETDPLVTRLKIALGRVPQGERGRVVAIWENICEVIGTLTTE